MAQTPQTSNSREAIDPVVAVHDTHAGAEATVRQLGDAGFDLKKLSIIGKNFQMEEHPVGVYTVGDRITTWAGVGSAWGALWGLLFGPAIFIVPTVGVVASVGPIAAAIVAALEGAVVGGGVSALVGALASLGLSREEAIRYEADIRADRFLVIVHGTRDEIARARGILAARIANAAVFGAVAAA